MNIFKTILLTTLLTSTAVSAQQLECNYDGHILSITGGEANGHCGIILGTQEIAVELPGRAMLRVDPLAVISQPVPGTKPGDVAGVFDS